MKFVIVTAVFVTASYAWDLSQFGKQIACATTCAESAADSVGKCQIGKDVVSCLCKNLSGIKSHAAPCAAECGLPDQVQDLASKTANLACGKFDPATDADDLNLLLG